MGQVKRDSKFDLSTSARDALRQVVLNAGRGKVEVSDETRAQLANIIGLLELGLHASLVRDVVEDMIGLADGAVPKMIELFGEHISGQDLPGPDRTLRRIFVPIVANPSERCVDWIIRAIDEKPELTRRAPRATKDEFGQRLQQVANKGTSLSDPVGRGLQQIAGSFGVELTPSKEEKAEGKKSEPEHSNAQAKNKNSPERLSQSPLHRLDKRPPRGIVVPAAPRCRSVDWPAGRARVLLIFWRPQWPIAGEAAMATNDERIERVKRQAQENDRHSGCSQAVLLALQDEFGVGNEAVFKSATVLSGGVARHGETCGALLGALMALGLVSGREKMEDTQAYREAMEPSAELIERFKEELKKQFGFEGELDGTLCQEIQEKIYGEAFDMTDPEDYKAFLDAGGHSNSGCFKVCGVAAQVAAEKMLELMKDGETGD